MLNKYENSFKNNFPFVNNLTKSTDFFNNLDNKRSLKSTIVKVAKGDTDLFVLDTEGFNTKNNENENDEKSIKESKEIFSRSHVNLLNNFPNFKLNQTELKEITEKDHQINDNSSISNFPNMKKGMFSYPKSRTTKTKISLTRGPIQNRLLSNEKSVLNVQQNTNKFVLKDNLNKAKTTSFQTKESNNSFYDKSKSVPKINGLESFLEKSSPTKSDGRIINTIEGKNLKSHRSINNESYKNRISSKLESSFAWGEKKSPERKRIMYKSYNNLPINKIDEDEDNKLDYLSHLTTPRILLMNQYNKLIPYIFKLVPTEYCFTYGVEHYNLEFVNISNELDKGIIDLLFISECKVSSENSFKIILNNGKERLFYEIICEDKDKNSIYVEALNYITHVTKLKLQSLKKYN